MQRSWFRAVVLPALALWFLGQVYLSVYTVDDAFIVYRFAENIADGRGIVFNPGERVEGVTCLSWALLLALVHAAGADLVIAAPVLSSACGTALLLVLPGIAAALDARSETQPRDWLASILLAVHPGFAYWSAGSLETVPFALVLTLALRAHLRELRERRGGGSAAWMGLAMWTRPEAPLFAAALAADRFRRQRESDSGSRRVALWIGIVAACAVALLAFRLLYFGDALPNTYYAKAGGPLDDRIFVGWRYLQKFLPSLVPSFGSQHAVATTVGGAAFAALLVWGWRRPERRVLVTGVAAGAIAVVFEGGDWMPLHRFWVPVLPGLALLAAGAVADLAGRAGRILPMLGVGALLASQIVVVVVERDGPNGLAINAEGYRHAHLEVARYLSERARPNDTVALMDVGLIGWKTGLRIRDISGLVDREIARAPGPFLNKEFPVERLLDEAPRFFVLVDGFPTDARIARHPRFRREYALALERNHRFNWTPPGSYTLHVFERMDTLPPGAVER